MYGTEVWDRGTYLLSHVLFVDSGLGHLSNFYIYDIGVKSPIYSTLKITHVLNTRIAVYGIL